MCPASVSKLKPRFFVGLFSKRLLFNYFAAPRHSEGVLFDAVIQLHKEIRKALKNKYLSAFYKVLSAF